MVNVLDSLDLEFLRVGQPYRYTLLLKQKNHLQNLTIILKISFPYVYMYLLNALMNL